MTEKLSKVGGTLISGFLRQCFALYPFGLRADEPQTIATADDVTYTVAQVTSGPINRDCNGAARTDTLPPASAICNTLKMRNIGDTALLRIANVSDAAELLTLAPGAGMTFLEPITAVQTQPLVLVMVRSSVSSSAAALEVSLLQPGRQWAPKLTTTINTAGAGSITGAAIRGGFIARDPNGSNRTDTVVTGTALATSFPLMPIGATLDFAIENTADAAETITVAGNTGVTLIGTATIGQGAVGAFRLIRTGATAFSLLRIG